MPVPNCLCNVVLCSSYPEGISPIGDGVQVFDHFEQCPLHTAAAEMYEHSAVILPHLMNTNLDADLTDHVLKLKRLLEEVAGDTKRIEERDKLSEQELPKASGVSNNGNGVDGSGQDKDV